MAQKGVGMEKTNRREFLARVALDALRRLNRGTR